MITPILLTAILGIGPDADYARDIKPLLAARCTSCHGSIRQKAGLRLDAAELIRRGGDGGPAIEPGQSGASLLIERVTAAEKSERMPPESEGTPLSAAEVATLRAWIDRGARAPAEPIPPDPRDHWAFRPPRRPAIPADPGSRGTRNPIDLLLAAAHRARGLKPAPAIGRDLWLRRVTLDLIGLPPTPEELHAFRVDGSPDAEIRVIDRLLASPRHGERWARHWMDVWRYSDWYGLGQEVRFSHPHIWHWRDWIVESLNTDKGYDRMVVEMLAGDELAPDDPDTVRATGFLARNWDIFNRNVWLANTVEHTSRAFLGLTMQCARCHDHKFDPIAQLDYYRLRAFFEPYHVRLDRVPGEPDRTKAGIPRVFDDFLDRPTYLFIRGDEARPDKSHPLQPGTPAVLGGSFRIAPVPLPLAATCPDKRPFVIAEAKAAADRAVNGARQAADAARRRRDAAEAERKLGEMTETTALVALASAPTDKASSARSAAAAAVERSARARLAAADALEDEAVAGAELAEAEARRSALLAVLAVERLEDDGARASRSASWTEAARAAVSAQRTSRLAETRRVVLQADRDENRARRTLEALLVVPTGKDDAAAREARSKVSAKLAEARVGRIAAVKEREKAESLDRAPLTTEYTPRALEFPRAKTTYRDVPPNSPYSKVSTGRRLALARWIVDRGNPLAARVAVNHVWARHFGEPLVASVSDFGLRSPRPELADLLDWLAVELMESGWSLKHLHRLICTSEAYRMRSSADGPGDPNLRGDPDNRYAWRMNARRMEGEVIRDTLLALSGRLDATMGGADTPIDFADSGTRRTLYYRMARDERIALLTAFDAPNVEECYRRYETIVPQQALAMMNSKAALAAAERIAASINRDVGERPENRRVFVISAFERMLGRLPTKAEQSECLAGLARLAADFEHESPSGPAAPGAEARARAAIVHVLLNHNDFVTIR